MKRSAFFLLIVTLFTLSSCSYKRLTYLQDMDLLATYDVAERPDAKIGKDDKLSIIVTCKNPALAAPFSIVSGNTSVDPVSGEIKASNTEEAKGYTVDKRGIITFPVLGEVQVEGLTLKELEKTIADKIIENNYIKDPVVIADFMNFKITMLGEVSNKGNYVIKDGSINILEAIALAGDLTTAAIRNDIWVIRTEDGKRSVYSVNLLSASLYDSPAFYLQQNDVVYVKPRKSKLDANSQLGLQISSMALSVLSTAASISYWISILLRK